MTINAPAAILLADGAGRGRGAGRPWTRSTARSRTTSSRSTSRAAPTSTLPRSRCASSPTSSSSAATSVPKWNTISISGYHIREAGSTAVQEVAFTSPTARVRRKRRRVRAGRRSFAPRLSFFFVPQRLPRGGRQVPGGPSHVGADQGAFRREGPPLAGAALPRADRGLQLTAQQPENNVVRVAYQAMAAVLGGCQSLHTNSFDEALALPTEDSVRLALRTQQVLAYETGSGRLRRSPRRLVRGGVDDPGHRAAGAWS
jgi:methylmalonyl-CoA mutase, N-terminal domain